MRRAISVDARQDHAAREPPLHFVFLRMMEMQSMLIDGVHAARLRRSHEGITCARTLMRERMPNATHLMPFLPESAVILRQRRKRIDGYIRHRIFRPRSIVLENKR